MLYYAMILSGLLAVLAALVWLGLTLGFRSIRKTVICDGEGVERFRHTPQKPGDGFRLEAMPPRG